MSFLIAAIALAAFILNVTMGAITGTPILGSVSELLLLILAAVSFVFEILKREAAAKRSNETTQ